ncbi:MAG: OmcA/MtrC family decaheme c-type cytochrome [Bryobacteraceae bacterium]|jgi:OmcA/MtrC family decaheme c-type cytochrome|nr:OmcA/MtrC family decaheme c-type cytochrome [Bryobacteraceae bacterium]
MRTRSRKIWALRAGVVFAFLIGSLLLVSAEGPQFTVHDKAYYADANLVAFVRPGLKVEIVSASIDPDGTIKTRFKISDPRGLPLDREGVFTPGPVSLRFLAAYIPRGSSQYVSYITRTQTSPITGASAVQATDEVNGTFTKVADGEYIYTFRNKAPANFDRTATHTIGITASRNLSEFDLGVNLYDTVYHFVPDGSKPAPRDLIKTATCNKCHQDLSAHGQTGRKSLEVCILCHTPQTTDPDTGNTVDMPVMTHKIHMGAELPSVQAGKPYVLVGFAQTQFDFSTVRFPADTRNCTFCHEQGKGAAHETAYLKPNRAACGACHDNVNFATGENHAGLPQFTDNLCSTCHIPEGELEFDVSIKGAHTIPRFSRELPGTVFELVKVDDAAPGKQPIVTFRVRDRSGKPILPAQMSRLFLVLAGPTSDYASYVSEDARGAQAAADGTAIYTFRYRLPENAKGTYAVGIEGYRNITLLPGTLKQQTVRDAGVNKVLYFSVDGTPVEPRRTVVALEKCNACHFSLSLHGDNRNQIEQCVLCHNPNETDRARRPADRMPPESVNFVTMIHRIHAGEEQVRDFTIYGFGNVPHNYNEVRYPGDLRNCNACHVNNSQQVPLDARLLPVTDPRGWLNPVGPTTSACTGCHAPVYAASHALANTTQLGESCAACHKAGAEFSVDRVHAR